MFKLILSLLVAVAILVILTIVDETVRIESETNPLDALVIDFYPLPEGQLPLKKIMKHRIKVTNSGTKALYIEFSTEVIAPYPMVIETITPEPGFLWLDPGQSEYIYTKMDEKWGEIPVATVIFHKEQNVVEEDLKTWINQRVDAKFQRVADVQVLEDFPRNIAGKTLKREMREIYVNN